MADPHEPPSPPPFDPNAGQGMPPQPPTASSYAPLPPKPSSWPAVVGIISIVWGSLGVLGGCCAVGMSFFWGPFSEAMTNMVPPAQRQQQMDMLEQYSPDNPFVMLQTVVGLALAILLIVSGVLVLKRAARGVLLGKVYAFAEIPLVIATAFFTFEVQSSVQTTGPSPMPAEFGMTMAVVVTVVGVLFQCAWPVFLLIWFSRSSIKEETAGWPS